MAKVPDQSWNKAKCICAITDCPTYPGEGDFFCARGKAVGWKPERVGCKCVDCEVFKEFNPGDGYFCATGKRNLS
ncbi:MAG: DUF2769 domain-containing protein [Thermoleophilia bacterium]|jgi:hypothetical protein